MSQNDRVNPFARVSTPMLASFRPKPKDSAGPDVAVERIDQLAAKTGFVSREAPAADGNAPAGETARPAPRSAATGAVSGATAVSKAAAPYRAYRHRTGRDRQFNVKARDEDIRRMREIATAQDLPLGKVLELALDALERDLAAGERGEGMS